MLKKNDLILLLTQLQESGVDVSSQLKQVVISSEVSKLIDVIKFINDNRQLDVTGFYEQLRKSYNEKRSSLYINLVREEPKDPTEALITLASLNLQILLYAKHIDNPQLFLSHSRAEEITRVLNNYYKTYDLKPVLFLRNLIRSDLKVFESIK
jgi:hypothetical protein